MSDFSDIKPGDRVYAVTQNIRRYTEVCKVGRIWVECNHYGRFDKQTGRIDGGRYSSPGRVYRTEEEYLERIELETLIRRLRNLLTQIPNDGVTADDIRAAAKLLRIELPELKP